MTEIYFLAVLMVRNLSLSISGVGLSLLVVGHLLLMSSHHCLSVCELISSCYKDISNCGKKPESVGCSFSLRPHGLYSPPGSSVHGILQARILQWVAIPFSRESSWPRDWTHVSRIASRLINIWVTRETQYWIRKYLKEFNYLFKDSLSNYSYILRCWGLGLHHMNLGRDN